MAQARRISLVGLNTRLLAVVLIVFEILIVGAVMIFVMLPMARRSADDLAGLMLLSAQTWSELPPETRDSFEDALINTHWLSLRAALPKHEQDAWHGIYLHFVEQALTEKTGQTRHFVDDMMVGERYFWILLPSGGSDIAVGFPASRIGTHPFIALVGTLLVGLVLSMVAAIWLARRISQPLQQLQSAVADVGKGHVPALLPDQWPVELADLADCVNRLADQVRELLAARTTLLAGVSHDLRTPLARMQLALALLADEPDHRQIERLERDIQAMNQLIGNILDLARGLENEAFVRLPVDVLLEDIAQDDLSGRLILNVSADLGSFELPPMALRRVLTNLLGNAMRYAPVGPIEIVAEPLSDGLRLGVLDRGPGIPDDQLECVFQAFHRVESSRSVSTGGTGLGLAIVRQLADLHGWTVTLQNREGGGLAAWVSIPGMSSRLAAGTVCLTA